MGGKLKMITCNANELPAAESALCARGMRLVKGEGIKELLTGEEYLKRPLAGVKTDHGLENQWALVWRDEEEE